jgi:energy-coupling factor transporter ATP-binding protein EcfA2
MSLTSSSSRLASLATALAGLGLKQLHAVEEVDPAASQTFLISPRVRLAQHFDLEVDLLIHDRDLGTVGLVYELPEDKGTLIDVVEKRIDQATYVRYLMLNDPELGSRLPITVEVVFVAPPDLLDSFGKAMSKVAHETRPFLDAVGVSLLTARSGGEPFSRADLRRAFPWLLQATRSWYTRPEPEEPREALKSIGLVNYRLPGPRSLELKPVPVHLVFGQNGSGKSSLVEALELTVTGKVERLRDAESYSSVIRNQTAGDTSPAQVILEYGDRSTQVYEIGPAKGISNALNPGLQATGFRLDQIVMDSLTRKGNVERAVIFVESFFPAERKVLGDFRTSRDKAQTALKSLPPALKEQLAMTPGGDVSEDEALNQLAWMGDPQNPLPAALAAACLPFSPEHLEALGGYSPELAKLRADWNREPTVANAPSLLGGIDEALNALRGKLAEPLKTVKNARDGLRRIEGWTASGKGGSTAESFLSDLNRWLRHCALTDLAERHCQLLEALSGALQAGWEPDPEVLGPFAEPAAEASYLAELRGQAAVWAEERNRLFQRVMATTPSQAETGATSIVARRPSQTQMDSLNTAGRWLLPASTDSTPLHLGDAIEQALETENPVQAGNLAIGTTDWTRPLLDGLDRLEAAMEALRVSEPTGGRNFQALMEARKSLDDLKTVRAAVAKTFVRQLQGEPGEQGKLLIEALNELMALFTPARWAYKDVNLQYGDDKEELHFRIGEDVQADLRLNTAELNLFTVALFLLCAVRVDNPLRLMVLDDPLQNMDELTVTTLARGLAKVSRLWGEDWKLLLLFHGQEDRDRFDQEIPLALYRLPWLSTEEVSKDSGRIPADRIRYDTERQRLTTVVRTRPEA